MPGFSNTFSNNGQLAIMPPRITSQDTFEIVERPTYMLITPIATVTANQTVTWSLSAPNATFAIDSITGVIAFTAGNPPVYNGINDDYNITVVAENDNGTDEMLLTITVLPLPIPTIGDEILGGKVVFIPTDESYALIMSKADDSTSTPFYPDAYEYVEGCNDIDEGSGKVNTPLLIAAYGVGSYAAKLAETAEIENYNGWFLPSIREWTDAVAVTLPHTGTSFGLYNYTVGGNYNGGGYWTSTIFTSSPPFNTESIYYVVFDAVSMGWYIEYGVPKHNRGLRVMKKVVLHP